MKKLVVLLLVVLLGLCAGSFWLGRRAETAINDQLTLVSAQYGPRFETREAKRGIFTSDYRFGVTLPGPRAATFDLVAKVTHGPLPVAAGDWKPALAVVDVRLEPGPDGAADFKKFLDTFTELRQSRLSAVFGLGGDCLARLSVPASRHLVRAKDGSNLDVNWGGAAAEIAVAPGAAAVKGRLDAPLLAVGAKDTVVSLKDLAVRSDTTRQGQVLYLGTASSVIGEIRFKDGPDKSLTVTNLTFEGNTQRRDALVDGTFTVRGQLAEGASPQSLAFDDSLTLKNLDFAALDRLMDAWQRIGLEPLPADVQSKRFGEAFAREASALFSHNPTLLLDGPRLGLPSGNLAFTANLTYAGGEPLPEDFMVFLGRCKASARAAGAKPALDDLLRLVGKLDPKHAGPDLRAKAEAGLGALLLQGLVVQDKDQLASGAEWDGKVLTVNGRPLPVAP